MKFRTPTTFRHMSDAVLPPLSDDDVSCDLLLRLGEQVAGQIGVLVP